MLAFTNGANCLLAEDFVIDFTSNPEDALLFFLKNNVSDFESAKRICHSLNGRLPLSLDELKKYTLRNENFQLSGNHFWTGISKEANSVYKWQDGRYIEYHKLGLIESWWDAHSSCSTRCCALTADPSHFNVYVHGREMPINLKEAPCEWKRSVACLVQSPHSVFVSFMQPALRKLAAAARYDVPHADHVHADYVILKKSISALRVPLESLTSEMEKLEKEAQSWNSSDTSNVTTLYHHKESKSSFNETINLCEKKGGKSLQVKSDDQVKQVATLLGPSSEYWIGYVGGKDGKYRSVIDSSEISYKHWMDGKPDCSPSESCCALAISTWNLSNNSAGELFDAPCHHLFNSLCTVPVKVPASHEQKVQELTFLTKLAVKQEKILIKLISMLTQLSSSFHAQ